MRRLIDESAYLRLIKRETKGLGAGLARAGLLAASGFYGAGVSVRSLLYRVGVKKAVDAGVPVVSVGNLTLGGTGKTPMVEWIAKWYRARSVRVAILSRGYGSEAKAGVNDEALALEQNLPDVPHLQDRDRVKIAAIAVEELGSELLILDDAYQHRRIKRDIDIVLLDALDPFGQGFLFPRGLLREPASALARAHHIILTRSDLITEVERERIRGRALKAARLPAAAFAEARHAAYDLVNASEASFPLAEARNRRVAGFCGIGNPKGFARTLAAIDAAPVAFRAFPDHHPYSAGDVAAIVEWSRSAGAELILTTQKDLVKLRVDHLGGVPLRAVRIGIEFLRGADELEKSLMKLLPTVEKPVAPMG